MNNEIVILLSILFYFLLLFTVAFFAKRKGGSDFFGGHKTPWVLAAIAAMGAPISGVTFISVTGMVATKGFSYLQMMMGFTVGYFVVAYVLMPLFYKRNLTSIYGYLEERFGASTHKAGAWFFFVSKILGASVRFFVICVVLQSLVFGPIGIPFAVNVLVTVALIFLYTSFGGVNTVIWTDTLKSLCLIGSVVLCIVFIAKGLGYGAGDMVCKVASDPASKIFFFDNPNEGTFFWKQFLGGIFMLIATTGLDQDLMQRSLHCANVKDSRKSLIVSAFTLPLISLLFLVLGVLLLQYFNANLSDGSGVIAQLGTTDNLFGSVVSSEGMPVILLIMFTIGLVAAAYSAAGSALTALTTSFSIDILGRKGTKGVKKVHALMAVAMAATILIFNALNNQDAISAVYTLASYTYGPILGMFAFGIICKAPVRDKLVPIVAIAAPILSFLIQWALKTWCGYTVGFELILINAALTVAGLCCLIKKK